MESSITKEYLANIKNRIAPTTLQTVEKNVLRWNAAHTALERTTVTKTEEKRTINYYMIPVVLEELRAKIAQFVENLPTPQNLIDTWRNMILPFDTYIAQELSVLDIYKTGLQHDEFAKQAFAQSHIVPTIKSDTQLTLQDKIRLLNEPFFHWNDKYSQYHPILLELLQPSICSLSHEDTLLNLMQDYNNLNTLLHHFRDRDAQAILQKEITQAVSQNYHLVETALANPFSVAEQNIPAIQLVISTFQKEQLDKLGQHVEELITNKIRGLTSIQEILVAVLQLAPIRVLHQLHRSVFLGIAKAISNEKTTDAYGKEVDAAIKSKEQDETLLLNILQLATYFNDKDALVQTLHYAMTRRLLSGQPVRLEETLIAFLKMNFGTNIVFRLETMYKDITAKEPVQVAKDSMRVLNTAAWNLQSLNHIPDWNVPQQFQERIQALKMEYNREHRLTFLPAHDSVTLEAQFGEKKYQLQMTSIQASVLFLFESASALTADSIATSIGAPIHITQAILHSLTATKTPLLLMNNATKEYSLRSTLNSQYLLIKIPPPPHIIKKEVQKETLEVDRKFAINAAIVRIMKARKQLAFQELTAETIRQLSHIFQPAIQQIKRSIEELIEREYLERDAGALRYIS